MKKKTNLKRSLALILVIVMASLSLVGCGGNKKEDVPAAEDDRVEVIRFGLCVAIEGTDGAYIEVAKAMGYFEEEGVDISMEAAYGTNLAKMLANGQLDMMYHAPTIVLAARDSGMEIKDIMTIFPTNFFGVAVREDSDIYSIDDMVGRKMAYLVETDDTTIGPILQGGGIDPDSVEWVLAGESRAQMLEEGSVDIAYSWSYQAAEWNEKFPIRWFNGDDYCKVNCNGIVASDEFIEKHPDLCAKVCRAIAKGMYFCALNPEAAAEIVMAKYPSLATNAEGVLAAIKDMAVQSGILESLDNYGKHEAERWENNTKINAEYGNISGDVPPADCWTDEIFELYKDWDRAAVEADAAAWKGLESVRLDIF